MGGPSGALRAHWPEYLMEAAGLGAFMVSAGLFATLLEHPGSALHQAPSARAIHSASTPGRRHEARHTGDDGPRSLFLFDPS